ncbi:MAG: hypothetical protein V1743_01485 [Nanoarchaeota archaeon]
METPLVIPDYRIIIPNSTWVKKGELIPRPVTKEKVPSTRIIQLVRFTIPTQDEIFRQVKTGAQEYLQCSSVYQDQDKEGGRAGTIPGLFTHLPRADVQRIAEGDETLLKHLRDHTVFEPYQPGSNYLQNENGILPDEIIECKHDFLATKGAAAYRTLMKEADISFWSLLVRLDDAYALPDQGRLERLLEDTVEKSGVFSVYGNFGNYQEVIDQTRLLMRTFPSGKNACQIRNDSKQILNDLTLLAATNMIVCQYAKQTLGGIFSLLSGMTDKDDQLFGKPGNTIRGYTPPGESCPN